MINLGINIGSNRTVYSICGYNQNGNFLTKTLLNDASKRETPSLLVFTNKERKAGSTAVNDFKANAESSFINISRLIGLNNLPNIEEELKYSYVKYDIKTEKDNNKRVVFKFKFEEEFIQAESNEIIAAYIQKINKQYVKYHSDFQFENLTISVPDFYTLAQKQTIKIILQAVGAKKINIINESTAITFYYGYNRYNDFFKQNKEKVIINVVFVDIGHSKTTFILSQLKYNEFKVLLVKSIPYLGGRDFDEIIFKYVKIQFKNQFGIDFPENIPKKKVFVFQNIKKCRENLSINQEMEIKLDSFYNDNDFTVKLSRDKFEGLVFNLFEIFSNEFHSFIKLCIKKVKKIDNIEMVGGLARTPLIENCLTQITKLKLSKTNLVDECTAIGGALFNFYNNWIDGKEKNFPIKNFKQIEGYNYENIYYEIINKYSISKSNSNNIENSPLPNFKELNEDYHLKLAFEKGKALPLYCTIKLNLTENANDNSQIISFSRKDDQKNKIVLINFKIFLPTYKQNTEYTEKSNYQSKSNHLHQNNLENKKSQEYNIYFYLNHCGYINLYKKQNFKNEETIKDYKIIDQELIDEFDCDNIIKTIINFINKIENIDKNENKLQEEKNKLSSLFYEQRSLIRSGSMREITILNDQMNSIERDLRNLNKIINKNEVKIGIEKIKGKLDKVKRSISEKNNKRMISKSMIDNDEKYEIDYYKKKNNQTKKRNIDWTPNLYTYKKEDKVHDNSFIKSNNINNIINNNKNEQKKANFYNKIPPNKTQNPQINFEFYNKKGDMKKDNYNFFYGDQYMP